MHGPGSEASETTVAPPGGTGTPARTPRWAAAVDAALGPFEPDREADEAIAVVTGRALTAIRRGAIVAGIVIVGVETVAGDAALGAWVLVLVTALLVRLRAPLSHGSPLADLVPSLVMYAVLGAAIALTGGDSSGLGILLVALPATAAVALPPWRIVVSGAAAAGAFALAVGGDVGTTRAGVVLGGIAAATALGVLLAHGRALLAAQVGVLAAERRVRRAEVLDSDERERRRIARELGAGPVQDLLAARQDLEEAGASADDPRLEAATAGLRSATDGLRATIRDLLTPRPELPPAAVTDPSALDRRATRLFAVWRVAATVAVLALGAITSESTAFFAVAGAGLLVHLVGLVWVSTSRWETFPIEKVMVTDMVAVGAVIALSAGAASPVLALSGIVPLGLVLTATPPVCVRLGLLLLAVVVLAAAPSVVSGTDEAASRLAAAVVVVAFSAAIAVVIAAARVRMERRSAHLDSTRRELLRVAAAKGDATRRRVAQMLHDRPLQSVIVGVQDALEAADGDAAAHAGARRAVAEALATLRDAVQDLSPPSLDHGGFGPALGEAVRRIRRRASWHAEIEVDASAELLAGREQMLLAIADELLTNAAKHASPTRVEVRVLVPEPGVLLLEVGDDGRGMTADRPLRARRDGHLGLASCRERVEAVGGSLTLLAAPGAGTRVRVRVPVAAAAGDPGGVALPA